ncbi:MAG: transposase, partial [Bdellovibrionales bacterium]|nr:transposase [Bdellovibrionales bacterium]
YRTYFHISTNYGVSESNCYYNIRFVKKHSLRSRDGRPVRTIELKISWGEIEIQPPQIDKKVKSPITAWCVRCWNEEEILEWILISTLPVLDIQSAVEKAQWYSYRWIIEEYHKCLKTGCSIEKRYLQSAEGLMALVGILGIIAIKLLELRSISREADEMQAGEVIPEIFIRVLTRKLCLKDNLITIKGFWKHVARLGGFRGRKSDGDPGWQTLWGGWLRLLDMTWAVEECG